jgi:hypothetical protein
LVSVVRGYCSGLDLPQVKPHPDLKATPDEIAEVQALIDH